MIGTTGLRALRIDCIIGIHPHERVSPQPVIVDLELGYDFANAAASDDIADVVNYDEVVRQVTVLAQERRFRLLETMAEAMAAVLLAGHVVVETVTVTIAKPQAVPGAAGSWVRVVRGRR